MRRFKDEGRLKAGFKLLMLVFYRIIFGEIRSGFFKYKIKNRK